MTARSRDVPLPGLSARDQDLLARAINGSTVEQAEIAGRAWSSDPRDPVGAAMMTVAVTRRAELVPWLLVAGVSPNVMACTPRLKRPGPAHTLHALAHPAPGGRNDRSTVQMLWPPFPEHPSSALRQALWTATPAALDALLAAGARWEHWEDPQVDPIRFLATTPRPSWISTPQFRADQLARLDVVVQHGGTLSAHAATILVPEAVGTMERTCSPHLVARLIELGADPFARLGEDRRTALHQAMRLLSEDRAAHGHALLDRGLDPSDRDAHGITPVDLLQHQLDQETWVSDTDRQLLNRMERAVLTQTLDHNAPPQPSPAVPRSRL